MKKASVFLFCLLCAFCTGCQGQSVTESLPELSLAEQSSAASDETSPAQEEPPKSGFALRELELPTAIDDTLTVNEISDFDYSAVVQDVFGENFQFVALWQGKLVIQKNIPSKDSDNSTLEYFKYDISTGTTTKLNGSVPNACFLPVSYALVDGGRLVTVCESAGYARIFFTVDLVNDTVQVTDTTEANPDTESYYFKYSWDDSAYMQLWFEIDHRDKRLAHISKCTAEGETEIISQRQADSYAFSDHKIFELATDAESDMKCVNILNDSGVVESTILLPEVDEALQNIDKENLSIMDFKVIGDQIIINLRDEYNCSEVSFLYQMTERQLFLIPECRFIAPVQAVEHTENLYFYSVKQGLDDPFKLYCIDRSGHISLAAENLSKVELLTTDGEHCMYFHDSHLYQVN